MNMFISNRNTVEMRAHHAVLNPTKAINWLFICVAIVKYAEKHSSRIIKNYKVVTPLSEVLNYYGDTFKTPYAVSVSKYLTDYYIERVMFFSKLRKTDDVVAKKDFTQSFYSLEGSAIDSII